MIIPLHDMRKAKDRARVEALILRRRAGREPLSALHAARHKKAFGRTLSPAQAAERIIDDVRRRGLPAILRYTRIFNGVSLKPSALEVPRSERRKALSGLSRDSREAFGTAIRNVRSFALKGLPRSWKERLPGGGLRGERFLPLDRVGITVPAQAAPLPSTLIMNAVPARAAGVRELVVVTAPGPGGLVHPAILAAAELCGVDRLFRVGGAQALAALAYGIPPFPKVDKITGPGNAFVAAAKKILQGDCGTDGRHLGPSEVLFLSDGSADPRWAAGDLLAQAEHDAMAGVLALSWNGAFLENLRFWLEQELPGQPRQEIASQSLSRGALIRVRSSREAFDLANRLAPEHLTLDTKRPWKDLPRIRSAGAVFLGSLSPEAAADYAAGPNHVLPTAGTARFDAPLSARDFVKASNVLELTASSLRTLAPAVTGLARLEGLEAHARSVEYRLGRPGRFSKAKSR